MRTFNHFIFLLIFNFSKVLHAQKPQLILPEIKTEDLTGIFIDSINDMIR